MKLTLSRSTRWLSWRPLAAAAAGLVLGMFCTSVVFGYVVPRAVAKEKRLFRLINGDFEQSGGALPTNPPASFNIWSGDGAEVIAESGEVSPKSGRRMLRFTRAETDPHTAQGLPARCDVYQLLDLREVWGQVAAVHLGVIRFTDEPQPGAEFGDCYLDDVSLMVTARPLRQKE